MIGGEQAKSSLTFSFHGQCKETRARYLMSNEYCYMRYQSTSLLVWSAMFVVFLCCSVQVCLFCGLVSLYTCRYIIRARAIND